MHIPKIITEHITQYCDKLNSYPRIRNMYEACYLSTLKTALELCEDNTYFVLTGDIPAMWLRDSAAQITHYVPLSHDSEVSKIIEGVMRRQLMYIQIDPYANAFNRIPDRNGHTEDIPTNNPWVFERKYEVDSLCYPIRILYLYWKHSGNTEIIKQELEATVKTILTVWKNEQHHYEKSLYSFSRPNGTVQDRLSDKPLAYTGMTWSGFRPSDDCCSLGYLTASNMFAAVVLGYMAEMLNDVCKNKSLSDECIVLKSEIDRGIKNFAVCNHKKHGKIYACETDGLGNYALFDDANIPSLLSIPYIGYESRDSEIYKNTRKFILSRDNPYYYEGSTAEGIGSPHTPTGYIWHLSLIMQALTSDNASEIRSILNTLSSTDDNTNHMHESFCADNPSLYTRPWFTWPDSLFAELVENCIDNEII